jgi:hypothetical protein
MRLLQEKRLALSGKITIMENKQECPNQHPQSCGLGEIAGLPFREVQYQGRGRI